MRGWPAAMLLCVAAGSVATGARASSASVTPGAYPEAGFAAGSEPAGGYEAARGSAPAGGSEPARSSTLPTIRLEARDRGPASPPAVGLSAERARLLLRSLTLPGWAELSAGRRTSATVFGLAELSVWTSFTAFRIQSQMRRETYERTARLFAGVDLHGRDEEFRRIIGSYISSDEYNLLVVYRDAANLYYDDPAAYREYIAQHSIGGRDAWSWDSDASLLRYRAQRKSAQRAGIRANTALACAVVNRLLSMAHAARVPTQAGTAPRSWNIEVLPAPGNDALAYRLGVRASF